MLRDGEIKDTQTGSKVISKDLFFQNKEIRLKINYQYIR
jgi:hypothetical protein